MSISVILPTFNEKENISVMIPEIEKMLKNIHHEIIVVDDNSPDGTAKISKALNRKYGNIITINRKKERGIGSAIRCGYNAAKNDIIVSIDSDLSFDIKYILELRNKISLGYGMVIGGRYSGGGGYQKEYFYLKVKSKISEYGNKVIRLFTGIKINDFSVNCRAIKKTAWQDIVTKENSNFFLFETILRVHRNGYKVGDIPIYFKQRKFGRSKLELWREIPSFVYNITKYVILKK